MSEIQATIHPETKLLSSCEPVKPDKLCSSKIQYWDRYRLQSPITEGANQKEEKNDRSQAIPKSNKANSIRF